MEAISISAEAAADDEASQSELVDDSTSEVQSQAQHGLDSNVVTSERANDDGHAVPALDDSDVATPSSDHPKTPQGDTVDDVLTGIAKKHPTVHQPADDHSSVSGVSAIAAAASDEQRLTPKIVNNGVHKDKVHDNLSGIEAASNTYGDLGTAHQSVPDTVNNGSSSDSGGVAKESADEQPNTLQFVIENVISNKVQDCDEPAEAGISVARQLQQSNASAAVAAANFRAVSSLATEPTASRIEGVAPEISSARGCDVPMPLINKMDDRVSHTILASEEGSSVSYRTCEGADAAAGRDATVNQSVQGTVNNGPISYDSGVAEESAEKVEKNVIGDKVQDFIDGVRACTGCSKSAGSGSVHSQPFSSAVGPSRTDSSDRTLDSGRNRTHNRTQHSGAFCQDVNGQALNLDRSSMDKKQRIRLDYPNGGSVITATLTQCFQVPKGKCRDVSVSEDKDITVATGKGPYALLRDVQTYRNWLPPPEAETPCRCVAWLPRNGLLTRHHSLAVGHKSMRRVEFMQVFNGDRNAALRAGRALLEGHCAWCVRFDRNGHQLSVGSGSYVHIVPLDGSDHRTPTTVDAGGTVLTLAFAAHSILYVAVRKKDTGSGFALQAWATSDARSSEPLCLWEKQLDRRPLSMCCDPRGNCYMLTKPLPSQQQKPLPGTTSRNMRQNSTELTCQSALQVVTTMGALIAEVALVDSSQGGCPVALSADGKFTLLAVLTGHGHVLLFDVELPA